jgi:hypothetical protein
VRNERKEKRGGEGEMVVLPNQPVREREERENGARERGQWHFLATGNGISGEPASQTPLASVPRAVFTR